MCSENPCIKCVVCLEHFCERSRSSTLLKYLWLACLWYEDSIISKQNYQNVLIISNFNRYELYQKQKVKIPVEAKLPWFYMKNFDLIILQWFFFTIAFLLQTCKDVVLTRLDKYSNAFIAMSVLTIVCFVSFFYIHRF